jgi:hypothetical protein
MKSPPDWLVTEMLRNPDYDAPMIDAVLSYHMNPQTCGVAKFNHALAKRLGVPCLPIGATCSAPLLSVKRSEFGPTFAWLTMNYPVFDLLAHDRDPIIFEDLAPRRVFYADELGCPSTIEGNPTRGAYRVLVFGMAHKLLLPHFETLKAQLDDEHPDYTIELSTAVHEGSPWDTALTDSVTAMRGIFGDHLRVLGYLGDDALAKELTEVNAVACYFVPALRANNTTYWAAVEAGKTIYTNRDEHSPQPADPPVSWDRLVELLRG